MPKANGVLFQILFMVGKGCLKPDMSLLKKDTPKALKRLLQDCIKFNRDERPLFPQVPSHQTILQKCFVVITYSLFVPIVSYYKVYRLINLNVFYL